MLTKPFLDPRDGESRVAAAPSLLGDTHVLTSRQEVRLVGTRRYRRDRRADRTRGRRYVVQLPDVNRVVHESVNVEQASRVNQCIIHDEFGTFDGNAYAKARPTLEDRGYISAP